VRASVGELGGYLSSQYVLGGDKTLLVRLDGGDVETFEGGPETGREEVYDPVGLSGKVFECSRLDKIQGFLC